MNQRSDAKSGERPETSPATSLSLLERVRDCDHVAWERLVDVYAPLVYHWCRRAGIKADEAPDVLQEVFLAVATHLKSFRRDRPGDSFRGWLWTLTRHKICDQARHQKRQPVAFGGSTAHERFCRMTAPLPAISDAAWDHSDEAILAHRLMELIRPRVEERTWQAFWRLVADARSGPDVAAELGMSLQAVHQAKYRVLQLARQEIDGLLP